MSSVSSSSSIYTPYVFMYTKLPIELAKLIDSYISVNLYRFGKTITSDLPCSFALDINASLSERKWLPIPGSTMIPLKATAVILNDRWIYMIGGISTSCDGLELEFAKTVECFDILTLKWTFVTPMQYRHRDHFAVTCNDKIFVIDVWSQRSEVYDVKLGTWKLMPIMLEPHREWMSVVIWREERIFVFGGKDHKNGDNDLSSCEYFDISTKKWISIADMLSKRWGAQAVVLRNDCIAVMGGSIQNTFIDKVELYNPITNKWSNAKWKLPMPLYDFVIHRLDDLRFVIGNPFSPFEYWLYHNDGDDNVTWELLPTLSDSFGFAFV